MDTDNVTRPGRYLETVTARSVLFFWAAWNLGISILKPTKRLGLSQPTATQSLKRGEKVLVDKKLKFMP